MPRPWASRPQGRCRFRHPAIGGAGAERRARRKPESGCPLRRATDEAANSSAARSRRHRARFFEADPAVFDVGPVDRRDRGGVRRPGEPDQDSQSLSSSSRLRSRCRGAPARPAGSRGSAPGCSARRGSSAPRQHRGDLLLRPAGERGERVFGAVRHRRSARSASASISCLAEALRRLEVAHAALVPELGELRPPWRSPRRIPPKPSTRPIWCAVPPSHTRPCAIWSTCCGVLWRDAATMPRKRPYIESTPVWISWSASGEGP